MGEKNLTYIRKRECLATMLEIASSQRFIRTFQVILASCTFFRELSTGSNKDYLKDSKQQILTEQNNYYRPFRIWKKKNHFRELSAMLQELIAQCLRKRKGLLYFLNRRGFAGYIYCRKWVAGLEMFHCDFNVLS